MEQGIVINDGLIAASETELASLVENRREKLRAEKEKQVKNLLSHIAGLPSDKKLFEIHIELSADIRLVPLEICLDSKRLGEIIVYRIMCQELCPAAEFGLCIGGLSNLATREKCRFCLGHGTAEWDDY